MGESFCFGNKILAQFLWQMQILEEGFLCFSLWDQKACVRATKMKSAWPNSAHIAAGHVHGIGSKYLIAARSWPMQSELQLHAKWPRAAADNFKEAAAHLFYAQPDQRISL